MPRGTFLDGYVVSFASNVLHLSPYKQMIDTTRPSASYTRVTSIFASRKLLRCGFPIFLSVIASCTAEVGKIRDKLLRPNLLESQTTIVRRAVLAITRFTRASS